MTVDDIRQTIRNPEPPPGLSDPVRALWHEAHGDWKRAHEIAQLAARDFKAGLAVPPEQALPVYVRDSVAMTSRKAQT